MTMKTFKPGELLTAQDVNTYLVNDTGAITEAAAGLEATLDGIEIDLDAIEAQLDLTGVESGIVVFRIDETTYANVAKHDYKKTGDIVFFSATFPPVYRILYVITSFVSSGNDGLVSSPYFKIEGNTIYSRGFYDSYSKYPHLVILQIKEG